MNANTAHPSANAALAHLLGQILDTGEESAPRGKKVTELLGLSISFDMRQPLVTLCARELGYRFAPAEAAWILSGDNRVETIRQYSRFIWEFSDDGVFYSGAYGPKVVDQLTYVCDVLGNDWDSRQAVIDVWRPNPRAGRDIPCTLSFQFLVRERKLHVVQCMRSSDAWLGYPYDVFNASMLAGYVILLLRDRKAASTRGDLTLGTHTMMIGSSHVYEQNRDLAVALMRDMDTLFEYPDFQPYAFDSPDGLVKHLWLLASQDFHRCRVRWLADELGASL